MHIALHFGVHCTDEDRLLRALLKNKAPLTRHKILVPGPGRYRDVMVRSVQRLKGDVASPDLQAALLRDMLDHSVADRVVLSFEHFICVPGRVFDGAMFYEKFAYKPGWFRNLFSEHGASFHFGLRNPASLVPAVFAHPKQSHAAFGAFTQGAELRKISWLETVMRLKENSPDTPMTFWCHEDTPFIWDSVMRDLLGVPVSMELEGSNNLLAHLLTPEALEAYETEDEENPPASDEERYQRIERALRDHAKPEVMETTIDVPGWSEDLMAELTERYEYDIAQIATLPDVTFISP